MPTLELVSPWMLTLKMPIIIPAKLLQVLKVDSPGIEVYDLEKLCGIAYLSLSFPSIREQFSSTEGRVIVRTETWHESLDWSSIRRIKPQLSVSKARGDQGHMIRLPRHWKVDRANAKLVTVKSVFSPWSWGEENWWGINENLKPIQGVDTGASEMPDFISQRTDGGRSMEHSYSVKSWTLGPGCLGWDPAPALTCSVSWTNHVTSWFFNMHIGEMGQTPPSSKELSETKYAVDNIYKKSDVGQ